MKYARLLRFSLPLSSLIFLSLSLSWDASDFSPLLSLVLWRRPLISKRLSLSWSYSDIYPISHCSFTTIFFRFSLLRLLIVLPWSPLPCETVFPIPFCYLLPLCGNFAFPSRQDSLLAMISTSFALSPSSLSLSLILRLFSSSSILEFSPNFLFFSLFVSSFAASHYLPPSCVRPILPTSLFFFRHPPVPITYTSYSHSYS